MKRSLLLITVMLLGVASLWARPAYTKPVDVRQPDGTTVTLLMRGDEFLSFMTTVDGYTVVKGEDGYYRYAEKQDGKLKATAFVAKNADVRTADEQAFLTGVKKNLHADMTPEAQQWKERVSRMYHPAYNKQQDGTNRSAAIWPPIDYSQFKALLILVQWNDRQFSMDTPQAFYQRMTSEKNLVDESKKYYPVNVTGSARDYFYDNSMHIFDPTFDVVGPVTINYSCTYPKPKTQDGNYDYTFDSRMVNIIKAAINQVNDNVNFADYDLDNNGVIDMVYFVFAGYPSNVQGNDYRYMWPHANDYSTASYYSQYYMMFDGKRFGRYACGTEILDVESYASQHVWLDGIGTMCHEFSHVLGLADHYDANYEEDGQSPDPDQWDIMAGGTDFNYGLTPVGYNAFERHVLGFCQPQVLTEPDKYQLESFNTSNKSFIIHSAKTDEDFYIENRQQNGWDTYLPYHGLLVWRADTSNPDKWKQNQVNLKPEEMYFELLRASGNTVVSPNTPFPGASNVIDVSPETSATWGDKGAAIDLYDITEKDGVISFEAGTDLYPAITEDFEITPIATSGATDLDGRFCKWSLTNASVAANTESQGTGEHVVIINKSGTLMSSVLEKGIRSMKLTAKNSATSAISFYLQVSNDNGASWQVYPTKTSIYSLSASKSVSASYRGIPAGSKIRFVVTSNATSAACYIDDIVVTLMRDSGSGIQEVKGMKSAVSRYYNLNGQRVGNSYKGIVIKDGVKYMNK